MDLAKIKQYILAKLLIVITFFFIGVIECHDEAWEEDVSKDMKIGVPDGGYQKVELRCNADSMHVEIKTEDDFSGVIYTRGSFHKKQAPCFVQAADPAPLYTMDIPFDKCQTLQDKGVYSNVVVVQHDSELIMPGDAAFSLECDFSKPKDVTLGATMAASRITLEDPDPAAVAADRPLTVGSAHHTVTLTPHHVETLRRKQNDEL